jgi:hypothetical protein
MKSLHKFSLENKFRASCFAYVDKDIAGDLSSYFRNEDLSFTVCSGHLLWTVESSSSLLFLNEPRLPECPPPYSTLTLPPQPFGATPSGVLSSSASHGEQPIGGTVFLFKLEFLCFSNTNQCV